MSADTIGRPMEILLIEDSLTDACLTIGSLKKVQHRLTLIRDGLEAMEFLCQEGKFARAPRPDLILLDLHLPKKDGLEVLREIKTKDALRSIPIVILTSSEAQEDRLKSEVLGVDSYVTKPVDLDKFLALVKQLKGSWHADLILPAVE